MIIEQVPAWLKTLRRGPLLAEGAGHAVGFNSAAVAQILPHRAPMLLVDGIDAFHAEPPTVRGHRLIAPDDPILAGHFPEAPIYPGVLVVEAIGQLALTMLYLMKHGATPPTSTVKMTARATRIHHAAFFAPIFPGDTMQLHAQVVENDLTMIAIGQAWARDRLAAVAILEVHVDD